MRSFQISAVFPHLTVLENVRIALQRKRGNSFDFWRSKRVLDAFNERALALIADVGLASFATWPAVELPYGRKRALEIATTIALDPEMLLLDEPTAGMGHEDIDRIAALIKSVAADRTVLMVEHNLNVVAKLSNSITVLTRGRMLAEGDYETVSEQSRCARSLYGGRPCLSPHARRCSPSTDLQAWYGESHVLHGVSFDVIAGEVVTLLGRNGAGKTTTLKSIMGIVGKRTGSVRFEGTGTDRLAPRTDRAAGIAFCPEERGIFASLDVEENLLLPPVVRPGGLRSTASSSSFPISRSACAARAPSSPAASSRCWRSAASCAPARGCCCSTSRPRAWRRSSSSRSATPSGR